MRQLLALAHHNTCLKGRQCAQTEGEALSRGANHIAARHSSEFMLRHSHHHHARASAERICWRVCVFCTTGLSHARVGAKNRAHAQPLTVLWWMSSQTLPHVPKYSSSPVFLQACTKQVCRQGMHKDKLLAKADTRKS